MRQNSLVSGLFVFVSAFLILPSSVLAGEKALVIVDMQDAFATRNNVQDKNSNPEILATLAEKQRKMIMLAKQKNMPIMIVEYKDFGKTNAATLAAIGDYKKAVTVIKSTDGLMDNDRSRELAKKKLAEWGTREMIVMGANGGACVERTISGALNSGFKVWAYRDGIADLNYKKFVSPYSYNLRSFSERDSAELVDNKNFVEIKDPEQSVNFRKIPRSAKSERAQAVATRFQTSHALNQSTPMLKLPENSLPTVILESERTKNYEDPAQADLLRGEPPPIRAAAIVR